MRPEERIERFLEAYGGEMFSDEDAFVRFYQYKAFARHGTRATLSSAKRALRREPQALLEEFLRDTLASDGLAVRGGKNASTDTNGTIPKP